MSSSSNRRTSAQTDSVSAEVSTPLTRRCKSNQYANTTVQSTAANVSVSSPRTLRRLQSKSKTIRWKKSSYNDDSNESVSNDGIPTSQLQRHAIDDDAISMMTNESEVDLTSSTIINTLSLSNSNDNNNNNSNNNNNNNASSFNNTTNTNNDKNGYEASIHDKSPVTSDVEECNDDARNGTENIMLNRKKQDQTIKLTELLTHFDQSQDGNMYTCKTCQVTLKKQNRSTANLRRHIGNVHGKTMFVYESQLKQVPSNTPLIPFELKRKLEEKQINAIIIDSRPFGDFSRKGLRDFLNTAIPGYKPLHRTTVRNHLRSLFGEHRRKLRKVLRNISDLALTTDIWKDNRNRYFITITGHFYDQNFKLISLTLSFRLFQGSHIADRLAKFIRNEIVSLNIEQKVRSITTDNALNIVNAIKKLGIGIHISCMVHNLNLIVKSTLFPRKNKKESFSSKSPNSIDDETTIEESSSDDDASIDDYSSSEETAECDTSDKPEDESVISQQSSSSDDTISTSSDDETINDNSHMNDLTDPVLLRTRSLIKRVRQLVRLVHHSGPLSEYIREQAKEKKLVGDGLIIDCQVRWSSCYYMLNRFIDYQSVIENITILHRSLIPGLSLSAASRLKASIFTEEDWSYLRATRNVLSVLHEACRLLSGRRYPTLSISHIISGGLKCSLQNVSLGPEGQIENVIKKHLLNGYAKYFDEKLSIDQKHSMTIAAYLDPYTFRKMSDADKAIAEDLILQRMGSTRTSRSDERRNSSINSVPYVGSDPLDTFLAKCGITSTPSTTVTTSLRQRSLREQLVFYVDRVQEWTVFEDFWNLYYRDLPGLVNLLRLCNIGPASSVASESLFSISGYVQRKHRSSLASETLCYTMVLRDRELLSSLV